jgi:hypothetical protein
MGTEVIALGLQKIGRAVSGAVTIVEAQGGAESGHGDAPERALGDDVSPASLCPVKSVPKEVAEEQVVKFGIFSERFSDIFQEDRANDTPTTPHQGNLRHVQLPPVLLSSILDQHEALGVRDDFRRVERLLKVVDERLLITAEAGLRPIQKLAGSTTLGFERTQAASKDSLSNQRGRNAEI